MTDQMPPDGRTPRLLTIVAMTALAAGLLWASWPTLRAMAAVWSTNQRYSHGFLVPLFAAYLLWSRRGMLGSGPIRPRWWGVLLVVLGEGLRLAGARYYVSWLEAVALLPSLAGVAAIGGGWPTLRWAAPAIGFLFFMVPLPYRVEFALGYPLQRLATLSSNYALQTLGLPAVAEGNVILLNDARIGVVEACNGLGMLFMFFAFAVGAALVIRRPWVDKALLVLSAVPIALGANVARITLTGLLHETVGGAVADTVYHDLAGWLMMPMALVVMGLELWLLSHLFLEQGENRPIPLMFATHVDQPPSSHSEGRDPKPARSARRGRAARR